MKTLKKIQHQLSQGQFNYSRHAFKRIIERNISDIEIKELGYNAIIIENYPDDKYTPSCLLLGLTKNKRSLHLQVSLIDTDLVKIITVYEPSKDKWTDDLTRRKTK